MRHVKIILSILIIVGYLNTLKAQLIVKVDTDIAQSPIELTRLFDEEIPEGIPIALGVRGYKVNGGVQPYSFEWLLNGKVIGTSDIIVVTANKGDDLTLLVTDRHQCKAASSTSFNLSVFDKIGTDSDVVEVYPTLTKNHINIKFIIENPEVDALIRFFDVKGALRLQEKIHGNTPLTFDLGTGTYFVSIRYEKKHILKKIIVK